MISLILSFRDRSSSLCLLKMVCCSCLSSNRTCTKHTLHPCTFNNGIADAFLHKSCKTRWQSTSKDEDQTAGQHEMQRQAECSLNSGNRAVIVSCKYKIEEWNKHLSLLKQLLEFTLTTADSSPGSFNACIHVLILTHSLPRISQLLDVLHHLPLLSNGDALMCHVVFHVPDLQGSNSLNCINLHGSPSLHARCCCCCCCCCYLQWKMLLLAPCCL